MAGGGPLGSITPRNLPSTVKDHDAWQNSESTLIKFPVTTINTTQNLSFVGRDDILHDIHQFFNSATKLNDGSVPCCLIHGLGGQGKTQTALEYNFRHRKDYDATFLIRSETETEVLRSLGDICRKLRLHESLEGATPSSTPEGELLSEVESAREWLEATNRKWLLIFDNLEDVSILVNYLPVNIVGKGSIIITTQKVHMAPIAKDFKKIKLPALLESSGAELLFKFLEREAANSEEDIVAHEISKWVGGLPLAIATIGGFIRNSTGSPTDVFASMQRSSKVWGISGVGFVRNYNGTLATVFDLALSELSENSRHFIELLSFFNPDHIPEDMLTYQHEMQTIEFLSNEDEFLEITYDLGLRQLIKREESATGRYLSIHRSLQKNVLHALKGDTDTEKWQRRFQEAFGIIRAILPKASRLQLNEAGIWPAYYKYVPQVISLQQNSTWPDPPLILGLPFAKILSDIGTFLWHTGQFRDCDMVMKTAGHIAKLQLAEAPWDTESKELLSDIYLVTGILADCIGVSRRKESLEHRQILLRLRKEAYEWLGGKPSIDEEIRLGNAESDLACAYMQRGQFKEAGEIMEQLFVKYQEWGNEDEYPYEFSKYYHFSSYVLMARGDALQAIEFARKGLVLETLHAGGVEDSTVLMTKHDLACLLFNAGEIGEALELHEAVLDQRREICGEGSQLTLESYEATATLLHLLGNNDKSKRYFQKCLASRHRASWTREGIARAQMWFSRVLHGLGETEAAAREERAALITRDAFLKDYPEFLKVDPENLIAVFDQMLPMWMMQTTGKLQNGGRQLVTASSP